jgi:FG-GAP-like repeat
MALTWWGRWMSVRPPSSGRGRPTSRNRARRSALTLERLEDRTLPSFAAPAVFDLGAATKAVAVGHFAGPAAPLDVVTANANGTLKVLVGNGDGTFQNPVSYQVGQTATAVAVGDFDRDGKLDLAVTNELNGTVSVLRGNGDGTFQTGAPFAAGRNPGLVTVGDFRGNGILDLVVARSFVYGLNDHTVSVLLGNGDGTFQAPVSYTVGKGPVAALVGDFDRKGKLDLAVANEVGATVSVLPGNGDGSFGTPVNYGVGQEPTTLAAGDFNGDGFPDLVTGDSIHTLWVLLNAADGPPRPARAAAPRRPSSPPAGAFRGDGVAAFARLTPTTTEPDWSLVPGAADGTVRPPLRVAGVEWFFTAPAGDERQEDAARFPPAVPQVPRSRSRNAARTGGVPGLWDVPALLCGEQWSG